MHTYIGHFAALATSFVWSFTSVLFTLSGRKVGSKIVNRMRLLFAAFFVVLMHWLVQGRPFPLGAEPYRWGWLALSGLIGYVLGDGFLFRALILIGPQLSMLLMALAPVYATIMGWVLFDETLTPIQLTGILVAVGGVALVVTRRSSEDQPGTDDPHKTGSYGLGILFGLLAGLGQAAGLVASRLGLAGDFPALSGNVIRVLAAAAAVWLGALVGGQVKQEITTIKEQPKAVGEIAGGAFLGPFVGVWLSLIAIQRAPLGIASTLMSFPPIFLIPISYILFKERIGLRAIIGTLAAVGGTALLFLD